MTTWPPSERVAVPKLGGRVGNPHSLAAAPGGSFHHDRIADAGGNGQGLRLAFDHAKIARNRRKSGGHRSFFGRYFVAHRFDGASVRPDEDDSGCLKRARKGGALG